MYPPLDNFPYKYAAGVGDPSGRLTRTPAYPAICIIITLVVLGSGASLRAQEPSKLPADAITLRNSYIQATERAIKPLSQKYSAELERMRLSYMKADKLEEAVAINAEIQALGVAPPGGGKAVGFPQSVLARRWIWNSSLNDGAYEIILLEGGKGIHVREPKSLKWKQSGPNEIELTFVKSGSKTKISWNGLLTKYEGNDLNGKTPVNGEAVKD